MNRRWLFVHSGLLALLITGTAFAGRYQRTRDNKTRVWNENPKPGDLVTWSCARDAKGYATGYGTVTWFTPQNEVETGLHMARQRHYTVCRSESGMMVHGKFEETSATAEPKKKEPRDISERRSSAPSIHTKATVTKPQPSPVQEKATSPAPTPSPTPAKDSLDSLMPVPSSLKLNPLLRRRRYPQVLRRLRRRMYRWSYHQLRRRLRLRSKKDPKPEVRFNSPLRILAAT